MKTAEPKSTSAATHQKAAEFIFGKGEHSFFSGEAVQERSSFFSSRRSSYGLSIGSAIQTKLTIGQPNDKYEQEADATADKVVQRLSENKNENTIQQKPITTATTIIPFVQTKCATCEQEEKLQKKDEEKKDVLKGKLQKKPIFESNTEPADDEKNTQRKCAECEKEEKLQKKSDTASSQTASPNIESSLNSSKGSGSSLPNATKEQMENSFGADFSGVRIHNDSSAVQMNKDLNAQAFAHRSDIYFNSGKYDTGSREGQHLLAHELTHTLQQTGNGQLQKDNAKVDNAETKDQFEQRVYQKSVERLQNNIENLDKWNQFLNQNFDDLTLQSQVQGQVAADLIVDARLRGRESNFESWYYSRRPNQRAVDEAAIRGDIHGACGYCHSSNDAWERDNNLLLQRGVSNFDGFPSPQEMLRFDATYSEAYAVSADNGANIPSVTFDKHSSGEVVGNTALLENWLSQQQPQQKNLNPAQQVQGGGNKIAVVEIPKQASTQMSYAHSGLCDDVPDAGSDPAPPFDASQLAPWPGMADAFAMITRIRPVLAPLGSRGYRVLPPDVFSRLYDSPPQVVRSLINSNIANRQGQYRELISRINNRKINYLDLCRMVDELLSTTNEQVRKEVINEKYWKDFKKSLLDILIAVLSIVSLLLVFIFPPAALLLGAFVGGLMIGRGLVNVPKGLDYKRGRGAGVFSQGQEDMADVLILSGVFDVMMGAITAAGSISGAAKIGAAADGVIQKSMPTPGQGGWRIGRPTPLGQMYVNAAYPDVAVWVRGTQIEITNAVGDVIAHGAITPDGFWYAAGDWPAGELGSGLTGVGENTGAGTAMVPKNAIPGAQETNTTPAIGGVPKAPLALLAGPPVSQQFYANPAALWGKTHTEIGSILSSEGWITKPYSGTSTAYSFIKDTQAGRMEIVVNYGGGRHYRGTIGSEPLYYKISGINYRATKVIDPATYTDDYTRETNFRFIDGTNGKVLKQ